ncbi:MAG: M20/M25/M40 family metallo-hydrolase [Oscillospiraceae bacterium]|nr:M20/M25/M40 family metallo-hydrolase [Oscillospiraceae bacterium]
MDSSYDIIAALSSMHGVSGREAAVGQAVAERIRPYAPDVRCDDGNVIAHIGQDAGKPTLLLCAHLDQVGFLVTDITPDGFLRIGAVGGIDHRLLLGQPVTVEGSLPLSGVISILPPHLLKGEQAVPEDAQLCVDLGFDSAEALVGKVSRGDAVYFAAACRKMQGSRMTGPALDDRCGAAALILAAEQISRMHDLPCNVTFAFVGQEERSGHRGAKRAAFAETPDYAIAVDVTFGLAHGEDPQETFPLGGGPAIGISAVLDAALSDALTDAAKALHIPYQLEIMPESTGTDADALALAPQGTRAGTVSIPLRYMHTPVEVIDTKDVELTAQLLAAFAGRCGA